MYVYICTYTYTYTSSQSSLGGEKIALYNEEGTNKCGVYSLHIQALTNKRHSLPKFLPLCGRGEQLS